MSSSISNNRDTVWAFGGGVQSVAILVLIANNRLRKPDRVIMANTGRESSLTWKYTITTTVPLMDSLGMTLEIAPHELATVDLYRNDDLLLPVFTETGKFQTYCSNEWKKFVNRRYLRSQGYGPNKPIVMWFGMSLDEFDRMRESDVDWIKHHYPLCFDVKLRRHECVLTIERFGIPVPPKSACWMCPNRNDSEWLQQQREAPEDHQKAIELDKEIREKDTLGAVYLHKSRKPLDQVKFNPKQSSPTPLEECANYCWT